MNNVDVIAIYQLTSIVNGDVYTAAVYPCKAQRNGHIVDSKRVEWAINKVPCYAHNVPSPIENAVHDAFASGIYCAVFNGVDRV